MEPWRHCTGTMKFTASHIVIFIFSTFVTIGICYFSGVFIDVYEIVPFQRDAHTVYPALDNMNEIYHDASRELNDRTVCDDAQNLVDAKENKTMLLELELRSNGRPRICGMKTRVNRVNDVCHRLEGLNTGLTYRQEKHLFGHLMVFDKLKVLYCYVPKAGCTSWKDYLLRLMGVDKLPEDRQLLHGKNINRYGVKFMAQFTKEEQERILKDPTYKRFLVVRHPFDRLISAYNDKFKVKSSYGRGFNKLIKQRFGRNTSTTDAAPLKEFLTYLSDSYKRIEDEHWMPYTELCQPCYMNYDMVLKLETSDVDKEYFLKNLARDNSEFDSSKLPDISVLNPTERKPPSPVRSLSELQNLSSSVLFDLYNLYRNDFEMFSYTYKNLSGICQDEDALDCC